MPPPATFRPVTWPDQMLGFMRSVSPDQIDAMTKAAPDLRAQLLDLWKLARCPTRDEYDAHARATDGKDLLQGVLNWLTESPEKKLGVRVGVRTGYG